MMKAEQASAIKIFYCYARRDRKLREELETHLEPLRRLGNIISWHDRMIPAGTNWQHTLAKRLDNADIILLLISPNFMRSDYCYGIEMRRALERQLVEKTHVIPIILRPTIWQNTPLGQLQALPKDGKPITQWRSREKAFEHVAQEIYKVINILQSEGYRSKKNWMQRGDTLSHTMKYELALTAYEKAYQLDPNNTAALCRIGAMHAKLKNYSQALATFDQALNLDPDNAYIYQYKASALLQLQRYEEALICYKTALLKLHREDAFMLCGIGHALFGLLRYEEALTIYEQAALLIPKNGWPYYFKGRVLMLLTHYKEALTVFQQALDYDPEEQSFYMAIAEAHEKLGDAVEQHRYLVWGDGWAQFGSIGINPIDEAIIYTNKYLENGEVYIDEEFTNFFSELNYSDDPNDSLT